MPEQSNEPTAIELLSRIAGLLQTVAGNLHRNHLDRRGIRTLLLKYCSRAESDGRLLNASRLNSQCVEHGVFLAYVHAELLSWLARNNYTLSATSVKWYSWRKLINSKYHLPLFSVHKHTTELRDLLRNVEEKADLLYADLSANKVEIPPVAIDYRKVTPVASQGTPPEALHDLLHRVILTEQKLRGSPLT